MPGENIKYNISLNSFQNLDGSNLTIGGLEEKAVFKNVSVGTFFGFGTEFDGNPKLIFDFKGSLNYCDNLNQNLRVRNTFGGGTATTQIRYSPVSVNVPINDDGLSFYANPHYSGKYDYKNSSWTHSAGVFAGVTKKFANTSLSLEAQRYNLQDIKDNSGKNWSINAILSYEF